MSGVGSKILAMSGVGITPFMGPICDMCPNFFKFCGLFNGVILYMTIYKLQYSYSHLLPPSSRVTGVRCLAAASITILPTLELPV